MHPTPILASPASDPLAAAQPRWWSRLRAEFKRRIADEALEKLDLRWRFRAVVMAFGLPFLGYIVWAATEQAAIEKSHAHERAKAHAALIAARVDDYVAEADRLLSAAGQTASPLLHDPDGLSLALQGMRGHLPRSVSNIAVWSLQGSSISALDRRVAIKAINVADRQYFKDAVATLGLVHEGPLISRTSGDAVLQFARPVYDAAMQMSGVIAMSSKLDELIGQIDADGKIAGGALVTIMDRNGTIIARSADAGYWIGKQIPNPDRMRRVFSEQSGSGEVVGVDGQLRLSGYAVASRLPWLVVVGEPIEVAIAPVSERLLKGLGIGLVIFVIALFIAGQAAAWTIRPIARLALDADQLGGGDLSHRSAVSTGGEIATLAANFNRMADALQERARALATSQSQLRDITNNIPQQITYIDRDERYRFVNAYRGPLPVVTSETMIGKTVHEVRGDVLYGKVAARLKEALAGTAVVFDGSNFADGVEYHFRCTYVPDRDPTGLVLGVYAFTQDITQEKQAELLRLETERRLVTITDHLPAMIFHVDDERRFTFMNQGYRKWFRKPMEELMGQPFPSVMDAGVARQYDQHYVRGMLGETCDYEIEIPTSRGSMWVQGTFVPDRPEGGGKVRGCYGMVHDITAAKVAEQRLTRLAQFDTLTGLANRLQFNEQLVSRLADASRTDEPVALMFLDIDHFKQVNDRFGHATGDELLKEFAQRLSESVRPTDTVARLSGDEFVVLLEGLHSEEEPQFIARKIIAAVQKPFVIDDRFMQVSTSIGIAVRAFVDETPSALMKRADVALYDAKHAGRDTFRMAG